MAFSMSHPQVGGLNVRGGKVGGMGSGEIKVHSQDSCVEISRGATYVYREGNRPADLAGRPEDSEYFYSASAQKRMDRQAGQDGDRFPGYPHQEAVSTHSRLREAFSPPDMSAFHAGMAEMHRGMDAMHRGMRRDMDTAFPPGFPFATPQYGYNTGFVPMAAPSAMHYDSNVGNVRVHVGGGARVAMHGDFVERHVDVEGAQVRSDRRGNIAVTSPETTHHYGDVKATSGVTRIGSETGRTVIHGGISASGPGTRVEIGGSGRGSHVVVEGDITATGKGARAEVGVVRMTQPNPDLLLQIQEMRTYLQDRSTKQDSDYTARKDDWRRALEGVTATGALGESDVARKTTFWSSNNYRDHYDAVANAMKGLAPETVRATFTQAGYAVEQKQEAATSRLFSRQAGLEGTPPLAPTAPVHDSALKKEQ